MDDLPSRRVIVTLVVLAITLGLMIGWATAPLVWVGDGYRWVTP